MGAHLRAPSFNGLASSPFPRRTMMTFYKQQHQFYCGVDVHAKRTHVCLLFVLTTRTRLTAGAIKMLGAQAASTRLSLPFASKAANTEHIAPTFAIVRKICQFHHRRRISSYPIGNAAGLHPAI
jgi:hypothetical protein